MARPLGLGYLVFAGVVGGVAGVLLFAPSIPRGWFAAPAVPTEEGTAPVLPGDMQVSLESKDHEADLQTTVRLAAPKKTVAAPVIAAPAPIEAPKKPYADAEAQALLAEVEKQYRSYQWNPAVSGARKLADMNVSPAIRQRAADIAAHALPVGRLFGKLNDRDELTRGLDTNPSLVTLSGGRELTYAVPIQGPDKDSPVVDKDPLGYIAAQRRTGKVNFLVRGSKGYIATELSDAAIGTVKAVDQAAVKADKLAQLEKFRKTIVGSTARDPMAWYDLGRFAYQHRLDQFVVDALHQAVLLDKDLVASVREDRAGVLYASLISHMRNENKTQAAVYMGIIDRKYKDTEQGRQARLYYDGKTSELLAAAKETQRKADEEESRRLADMKKRAEDGDAAAKAAMIEEPVEEPAVATITGSADESRAQQLYEEGAKLCSDAIDKGNTPERDRLYGEAIKVLSQAVPLLSKLAEQEKDPAKREALEFKAVEANKMKFGATKMRRPGH
jgi:hypothetical protein